MCELRELLINYPNIFDKKIPKQFMKIIYNELYI